MKEHKIVVIGGGPAGMAAALAAYEAGVKDVVILDREERLGGILPQCIHNGFGLHKLGQELTGPEYAEYYAEKIRKTDIKVYTGTMVTSLTEDRVITASNEKGILQIRAGAVILAMGCRERSRGALGLCGTRPAGIYTAGTAQKLLNCHGLLVGKRVVILGSGDIGLIMARRMTLQGAKVEAVCEVMPYSGGLQRNLAQCLEDFDIPLYLSTTVVKVEGRERLEGVVLAEVDENRRPISGTERSISCDTLLISCGLIPENELARMANISLDPATGGALVDETRQTNAEGIFACGNVLHVHDLVDFVSDEGEVAGLAAAEYVLGEAQSKVAVPTVSGNGVRYVLPQRICDQEREIPLYFRVSQPRRNVNLIIKQGDSVLKKVKRIKVSPGEMEKVVLPAGCLRKGKGEIKVEVEV